MADPRTIGEQYDSNMTPKMVVEYFLQAEWLMTKMS